MVGQFCCIALWDSTTLSRSANEPLIKRRKTTTGLNSRFDRMIETVNILHTSPASSKSSRSGGRLRAASSSSASAVEFEMPRTPVDAYSEPHGRRLGADFVVMKMRGRESSGDLGFSANCGRYAHEEPSSCNSLSIPAWLSNTLSTLDTHHPLRRLMHVDSTSHDAAPATLGLPVELVDMPRHAQPAEPVVDHDSIFAFNPPGGPVTELKARTTVPGPPASAELAGSTERDSSLLRNVDMPFVPSHCSPIPDGKVFEDSPLVPFSTPGPASSVSAVPPSMFPLESVRRSTNSFLVSHANLAEQNGHEQYDHAFAEITNSSDSIASGQPALLNVMTANTGGDIFGGPPGDNEDPRLSIPAQLSGQRHIPRIHPTAPECHDYMRAVGGSINQISSSSPTLEDEVLPSVWRSATNTGMDPLPLQRTTESNALQAWAERRDLLHTPGPVNVTPIRSTSTRPVRIYFDSDSPADDTYYSDALDPECHVPPEDLASLDFKWEKFDRGHVGKTHTSDPSEFGINLSLIPKPRTPSAPDLQSVPRTPVLVTACSSPSSGIPVLHKESPEDHNDNGTWIVPTAAALSGASYPSRGHRAAHAAESAFRLLQSVFAPVPGIFVSPLRKTGEDDDNPSPKVGLYSLFERLVLRLLLMHLRCIEASTESRRRASDTGPRA